MDNKSLTLRLKNGKEEKFESGEQMFEWWIRQTSTRKSKKKNSKDITDTAESDKN